MAEYKFRSNQIILQGDSHDTSIIYDTISLRVPNGWDYLHVGDCGLGFGRSDYALDNAKSWLDRINKLCQTIDVNCYLIIGNHDNPDVWKLPDIYSNLKLTKSGDVGIFPSGKKALLIGGGISVDRFTRKVGESYWVDEATPHLEYIEDCDIMFSHDCPEHFNHSTHSLPNSFGWYCERDINLIDDCIKQRQNMTDIVKRSNVKTIFYGHFHRSIQQNIDGVYARCLDINELFEFDADKNYE